ncbi:MAG: hypothetical protein ABI615_05580 [Chthoniobacterales bacterium]
MSVLWIPTLPVWLIIALTIGLVGLLGYGCLVLKQKNVPAKWIGIFGALRLGIIGVFMLCLFQPVVSCKHTINQGPALLVMLDTSLSMKMPDATGKGTRFQEIMNWMESSGLQSKLAKNPHTYWFAFDQNSRPVPLNDLKNLKPEGSTTHYADSLSSAWDYYRQTGTQNADGGVASARVLLISDGNDLGSRDVVDVAQNIGAAMDTLAPASSREKSAASVAIANVQGERRIHLGSQSRFLVTLRQEGMDNKPFTLQLKEGGKILSSQNVTFTSNQHEKQINFPFQPTEEGIKEYEFEILKPPAGAAISNNHEKFSLQVVGDKNEVLLLEDNWRWEFKFLLRIFEDDPSFTFTGFLARGNSAYAQFSESDRKRTLNGFPQTRAELEQFDTIVLGDINPKRWSKEFVQALNRLVIDEGKSLIVIAGPNIVNYMDIPQLAALLPVEIVETSGKPVTEDGGVEVKLSPDGLASPLFFAGDVNTWNKLQPLDQIYAPSRKRPAASILLETSKLANAYGNLIVIAEHTVGRGRVLYVGTDALWKWQTTAQPNEAGISPYTVFWQQALRAMSSNRTSSGNANLWLLPDHSKYETDETITIRAEVQSSRALAKPKIQGKVTLPDKKQILLDFAPHPTQPGFYQAQFVASSAGQYQIFGEVVSEGKRVAEQLIPVDVEKSTAETNNTHIDEANLARIASDTGGKKIDRNDSKTWPTPENLGKISVEQMSTFDLWNNFTLLILLCLLLGGDWTLRLLKGFV